MTDLHRVVIIGGGFGGLYAARSLRRAPVELTLVDRRNFHLFQPLLYEVATAALSPGEIAATLRSVLRKQSNARVLMAEVVDVDVERRQVILAEGELPYDTLVVAAGAKHAYFGHDAWEAFAPGLKTIEDAVGIRKDVLYVYERAEREPDPARRRALLTFVVVGGGPTGVEMAGALAELARYTLRGDFHSFDAAEARVILVEALDRILPAYPPDLSTKARAALLRLGVEVWTGARVIDISAEAITIQTADGISVIQEYTVLWAAGVQASPLGRVLADHTGVSLDRAGRVMVGPELTMPGHPEIFVIGDLAHVAGENGAPLPGVAPVAMQQGAYVARAIRQRLEGKTVAPFHYRDKGSMAVIGRSAAVAVIGPLKLSGFPAWLVWLFIHLLYIVEFRNRVLIALQWGWRYFTGNRGARIITEPPDARSTSRP